MKRIHNISANLFLALSVMLVSTSCLKDNYVEDGSAGPEIDKAPALVELMGAVEATNSYSSSAVVAFDIASVPDTLSLASVRLAAPGAASKDLQVELEYAPDLINAYNDSNGTHYDVLPSDKFKLSSSDLRVTIPKGKREGSLDIILIPEDLLTGDYALAFRIKGVSDPSVGISGNFSNVVSLVLVKNIYDGIYSMTGNLVDATVPAISGFYPEEIQLITTGSNSVAMFYPVYADYYHPISSAGSLSVYGLFSPEFIFDPSGNGKVNEVVNFYGQPASNGRSGVIDPSGINKWDPVTKEMKVSYNMLQPGTTVRTRFTETFTYVGPR